MSARARPARSRSVPAEIPASPTECRQATVHEAKTHLSRLLVDVEAGATILITRRGKPVASLQPIEPKGRPVFGSMKGLIAFDESFFDPLPEDELQGWGEV